MLVVIYLTVSNIILKKKIQHLAIENQKLSTALTATFPYFKKELQNLYKEIVEDRTSELPLETQKRFKHLLQTVSMESSLNKKMDLIAEFDSICKNLAYCPSKLDVDLFETKVYNTPIDIRKKICIELNMRDHRYEFAKNQLMKTIEYHDTKKLKIMLHPTDFIKKDSHFVIYNYQIITSNLLHHQDTIRNQIKLKVVN